MLRRCGSKTTTLQVCPICSSSDTTIFDARAYLRTRAPFQLRRTLLAFEIELAGSRLQHCGAAVAGSLRWHVPEDPRIPKSCLGVRLGEELARQAYSDGSRTQTMGTFK